LVERKFRVLLENEHSFHRQFSDVMKFPSEHLTLFYNTKFGEVADPVFNHFLFDEAVLVGDESSDGLEKSFEEMKHEEKVTRIKIGLFVEDFWPKAKVIENLAVDSNYVISDSMEILSKTLPEATESRSLNPTDLAFEEKGIKVNLTSEVQTWNDIFSESFSIPASWMEELVRREKAIVKRPNAFFVLAGFESSPASAGLLAYRMPERCLGIYCVGTVPKSRGKGLAQAMLQFTEKLAGNLGCTVLTLQTIDSDGVSGMYKKIGYSTDFRRNVFMMPS
jgi:GNAT superfamily N-acetyltransferase